MVLYSQGALRMSVGGHRWGELRGGGWFCLSKQDPRDLREEGTFLKDMSVGSVPCAEAPGEPPGREASGESSRTETSVRAISVPSFFIHASSEHLFTDGHPGAGGPGRQGLSRGACPPEAGR